MRFGIITIFPFIFDSYFKESIIKRALLKKLIRIDIFNLRDFALNKRKKRVILRQVQDNCESRRTIDGRPYGGGPGMVIKIEPLIKAIGFAKRKYKTLMAKGQLQKTKVVVFSASGRQFNNEMAGRFLKYDSLVLVCGRYEGIDERFKKILKNLKISFEEVSVGPYVLTGGELPAMVLIDAVSRRIPGVLGKKESIEETRFGVGLPCFTRPAVFEFKGKKYKVPEVLLGGDHKKIEEWKKTHKIAGKK